MNKLSSFGFYLRAASLLCVGVQSVNAQTQEQACFETRELSCEIPIDSGNETYSATDAQIICCKLETILREQVHNLSTHAGILSASIPLNDSQLCKDARQVYHKCFWCSQEISKDDCLAYECKSSVVDGTTDAAAGCQEIYDLFGRCETPATVDMCQAVSQCPIDCQTNEKECGLQQNIDSYLGADTITKKKALVWVSRTTAFLSFLGASYILLDVFFHKKNRVTVFHQLVFGMACFDICTAIAWAFASAPLPDDYFYHKYGASGKVYGASGNDATCKAQAFFVQLGYTSIFYNVALSVYYILVLVYGWSEEQLKRARPILHGITLLVGFGLAFGGIPVYDGIEYGCHLLPAPIGPLWAVLVFSVIPIGISIVVITLTMLAIYLKVRNQTRASRKWRLGLGSVSTLERKVFWQCFFYALAFYITWPIMFSVYVFSLDLKTGYGFPLTVAFVAPLQGFSNFLVYIRPRLALKKMISNERLSRLSSTMLFWRRRSTPTPEERTSPTAPKDLSTSCEYMDPSVMITIERNIVMPDDRKSISKDHSAAMDPSVMIAFDSKIVVADDRSADPEVLNGTTQIETGDGVNNTDGYE